MLFISDELNKANIRHRWIGAISVYEKDKDGNKFALEFGTIAREIRELAAAAIK
jgi:hypothetical protein